MLSKDMLVYVALATLASLWFFRKSIPRRLLTRVHVSFTNDHDDAYPEHAKKIHDACVRFGEAYDATFTYPPSALRALDRVRALYSIREDALIACGEIRMRLPNDLDAERKFIRSYEDLDRRMNELVEDAKSRLGVFVHPGPLSSAFQAKKYRASNDVFR